MKILRRIHKIRIPVLVTAAIILLFFTFQAYRPFAAQKVSCGDRICGSNETYETCPYDCEIWKDDFEEMGPRWAWEYRRGTGYHKLTIEPAHKLKIDQNKLQNCRSNILNLVNVL